jgi:hypothetical protein
LTTPAWGGRNFGEIGGYERVIGKAYGEIDPQSPSNTMIQDIALAPKNARGMVEYSTDIDILRPADRSKSNGVLFFNIINRGNKGGLALINVDIPGGPANIGNMNAVTEAGDGFMQQQGYTVVWFGWQPDVVGGNNRMFYLVAVNDALHRGELAHIQELLEGAKAVKAQHGDLDSLITKLEAAAKKAQA